VNNIGFAAEMGCGEAMWNIVLMYSQGMGVAKCKHTASL